MPQQPAYPRPLVDPNQPERMAEPHKPQPVATRLQQWLTPYEATEPLAATFRAQQLQAMLRLTPLAMAVNIFNGAILLYQMAATAPWLWGWMLALVFMAAQGTLAWLRARGRAPRRMASTKAIRAPHAMPACWLFFGAPYLQCFWRRPRHSTRC